MDARGSGDADEVVTRAWVRLSLQRLRGRRRRDGDAPLHLASLYGHAAVVRVLLEKGANPVVRDGDGGAPRHDASAGGFDDVVDVRLEAAKTRGCLSEAVDARDGDGETPLHTAARGGHVSVVTRLVAAGASRDASSDAGPPFHFAEEGGDVERACVPDRVER